MATPATAAPTASAPTAGATPAQAGSNQQQAAQPGAKGPAAAQPTPTEIRKLKLKLDGQDVELPESEVIALAQQGKVSGKRFQEAAAIRKQAEDILKFAQENPAEFFKKTGKNARQWAEEYLIEELKREQWTPEQKKAAENEAKLKQYETERKAEQDRKDQAERDQLQKSHHDRYETLFIEALTQSGLPRTPYTVKRMAELQLVNLRKKLNLDAGQLAKVVREDYINEQKALFGALEGDKLLELMGPDFVKKLSKAQIAQLKAKIKPASSGATQRPQSSAGTEGLSWREYQKRNRRRA